MKHASDTPNNIHDNADSVDYTDMEPDFDEDDAAPLHGKYI